MLGFEVRDSMMLSFRNLFGSIGLKNNPINLLSFDNKTNTAIVQVNKRWDLFLSNLSRTSFSRSPILIKKYSITVQNTVGGQRSAYSESIKVSHAQDPWKSARSASVEPQSIPALFSTPFLRRLNKLFTKQRENGMSQESPSPTKEQEEDDDKRPPKPAFLIPNWCCRCCSKPPQQWSQKQFRACSSCCVLFGKVIFFFSRDNIHEMRKSSSALERVLRAVLLILLVVIDIVLLAMFVVFIVAFLVLITVLLLLLLIFTFVMFCCVFYHPTFNPCFNFCSYVDLPLQVANFFVMLLCSPKQRKDFLSVIQKPDESNKVEETVWRFFCLFFSTAVRSVASLEVPDVYHHLRKRSLAFSICFAWYSLWCALEDW